MVRPKLLIFSIWVFLLVTGTDNILTTEIEKKEAANLSKLKVCMHVLAESISQSNKNLSKSQKVQKMILEKFCFHKVVEYDEENQALKNNQRMVENLLHGPREVRKALTDDQMAKLNKQVEDTKKNENSDNNTRCFSCLGLFEKQYLNRFMHKDGKPACHHSTCNACETAYHDMYGDRCVICRKLSVKAICTYLENFYAMQPEQPRIFDGSSLAFLISTGAMTVLSIYITAENPMEGVWKVYIPGIGEGAYGENGGFLKVFSAFGVQQLIRDMWGFYFLDSTYFLFVTRNSTSLLMDARGIAYLVLPIVTALTAAVNLDVASVMTMIPLSLFVSDLYLKGGTIVSTRFSKFAELFPQVQFMERQTPKPLKGIKKFVNLFATNFLFWDFMGAMATAFNSAVWAEHGILISSIVNKIIYWDTYIASLTLAPVSESGQFWAKAMSYINVVFVAGLLMQKMWGDFKESRPTFNLKELGLFLFAGFAMQHSDLIQEGFLFINFAGMALLTIKLVHYICSGKCINCDPTVPNN